MSFIYGKYFYLAIVAIVAVVWLLLKYEKQSQSWITTYWFYKKSWPAKLSYLCFMLSMALFIFSLLDFRGPEKKIKATIPDQKTIVMIDTSASMLVEDVRPNRYKKALLVARHFVRKAAGHQIALVLFSDNQKRILPFTDDLDLVDSRIASMEALNINRGGSNIGQALQEAVQYFKANQGEETDVGGNILLITDSEENEEDFKLEIPDNVSVAVVGVGTSKGGPIPMRSARGAFMGYKQFKGDKVVSRLDEAFLKKLQTEIKNYNYWIVLSYSIPTEKILDFFKDQYDKKISQSDIRIRPVYAKFLIVPACLLLILSSVLGFFKSYRMAVWLLAFSFLGSAQLWASNQSINNEAKEEVNPIKQNALKLLKKHDLTTDQKLKLAETLIKGGAPKEGLMLYEENLRLDNAEADALFNMGTAYILNKKFQKGISILGELQQKLDPNKHGPLIAATKNNILLALQQQKKEQEKKQQQKRQGQQQEQNQEQDQKNQQGQQQNNQQNQQGEKEQQQQQNQQQKNQENQQDDQKNKDQEKKDKEGKNQNKKKDQKKDKGDKNQNKEKNKNQNEGDKKRKKLKSVIKQMLDFDRQSQEQYMNTKYRNRSYQRGRKDW